MGHILFCLHDCADGEWDLDALLAEACGEVLDEHVADETLVRHVGRVEVNREVDA